MIAKKETAPLRDAALSVTGPQYHRYNATATNTQDVDAADCIKGIKFGRWKLPVEKIRKDYVDTLEKVRDPKTAKGVVDPEKKKLPAILWSGKFGRRANDALVRHSGLICADLDDLKNNLPHVRRKLLGRPELWALFLSPTGTGLKAVFRVPADVSIHPASFRVVQRHVFDLTGVEIDEACKDVARLCFVSHDPDAYYNSNALELAPLIEPAKPKAIVRHNESNLKPNKTTIREMLAFLPKRPNYPDWLKIVSAVGDALPDEDAIELLSEWSPEEQPGEYASKLCYRLTEVTIGTLIYVARQHGWSGGLRSLVQKAGPLEWPDPQPLPEDLPPVPTFNFDWLPETIRPWIADISERMQCPPDFPAVGAMIALGSLIGRKIGIRPKRCDDWLVIPNLWGCVVGRPGVMKTPALEQPMLPLRRLVAEAFDAHQGAIRDHKINAILTTQKRKLVERKIGKYLGDGDEQAARAAAADHWNCDDGKPICRRYEVNDSTIEKLGELLAENPSGLLLFRDELSGFLHSLDREDRAGDRAKYLEMWTGRGELTYDRIERGTVRIPSNTLSILGGIQPDVLMAYVCEAVRGGNGNDGLLQRFQLFVWPDAPREWQNVDRWPDTKAKNDAFNVFNYLDRLAAQAAGADTSDGIPFLRFSGDAQERFNPWRAELEKTLRSGTEHPAFEAHLAKYRKLVPALALLIHLVNRKSGPVSLAALDKALLWASYLEAHARRIYSAVLRPDTAAARELAKHLQRGDLPERFTLRETYRKGWAGLSSKEESEAATEILCDLGWIRLAAEISRSTSGRTPSPVFEINPKILKQPAEPTDKTDRIDSGGSVGGHPSVSENYQDATNDPLISEALKLFNGKIVS